jgi:pyrimidine-nucleoside phosphorylase
MTMYEIIDKKKKRGALTRDEIEFFVRGVADNSLPDYQIAALLMAIRLNGMTDAETFYLTDAISKSGAVTDLSGIDGVCADKHSTGGVSDATTLIVVPILAALGVKIAKLSGRGLGHTGGTLDKLEAFLGYNVNQSQKDFIRIVNACGAAICGQTAETAPADKKLYALRDVTATVDSIPLIASSVMGKKLASGADIIVLDVKYGSGAFMKTVAQAKTLARAMVKIGEAAGKKTAALVTSMEQPLGSYIGSNLEVAGAIAVLKGEKNDLARVSFALAERILCLARKRGKKDGAAISKGELAAAKREIEMCVADGRALNKFRDLVEAHGGAYTERVADAHNKHYVKAESSGYIAAIDAEALGLANVALGGGRLKKDDEIDHFAGLVLRARLNTYVNKGDTLIEIHANKAIDSGIITDLRKAFTVGKERINLPKLIIEVCPLSK